MPQPHPIPAVVSPGEVAELLARRPEIHLLLALPPADGGSAAPPALAADCAA